MTQNIQYHDLSLHNLGRDIALLLNQKKNMFNIYQDNSLK